MHGTCPASPDEVWALLGDSGGWAAWTPIDEVVSVENGGEVGDNFGPVTVNEDEYFMMGDNRLQSCDSREWGTVPRENLIGPVFARYWPAQRIGFQ